MHIAVIGCGIAGPAAALFLKKLDVEVTVFDKVSQLCPVGAGFLLQPAGLHVLHQLGLASSLIDQGVSISGLHGINHRHKVVLDLHYADLVPHHMGLGMHRAVLYKELMQRMHDDGVDLMHPCEIIHVIDKADKVFLYDVHNQQHGPYDAVVIADGARSRLRHIISDTIKIKAYEWGALWTIGVDPTAGFSHVLEQVYQRTELMAGILPMGYQEKQILLSFFWSLKTSAIAAWRETPLEQWKHQVIQLWPQLAAFLEPFRTHNDFAFASYYDVRLFPWHKNRIVVIGDAAHGMSPQLGQGANLALMDARILFECLRDHPLPKAFAIYTAQRKSTIRYYQQASRFVTPWFQSSHHSMGLLRDLLHGWLCKTPIIKQQMLLTLACMKTGYFKSMPLDSVPSPPNER